MSVQRKSPQVLLFRDGVEMPDARVYKVTRTLGVRNNTATFGFRPVGGFQPIKAANQRLEGTRLQEQIENSTIEIEVTTRDGKRKTIHWGKVVAYDYQLSSGNEEAIYTSQLEMQHIGHTSCADMAYARDPYTFDGRSHDGILWIPSDDIIFNPLVDGEVIGNLHIKLFDKRIPTFVHPASLYRNDTSSSPNKLWSLADAVQWLCTAYGNADNITFPTPKELQETLDDDGDPRVLRNTKIPRGGSFGAILDSLLLPRGFVWSIELYPGSRLLQIVPRGAYAEYPVRLQEYGSDLDDKKSTLKSARLSFHLSDNVVNSVTVIGSERLTEAKFPLIPAWDPDDDDFVEALYEDHDDHRTDSQKRAWRDWVLNESGEYTDLRDTNSRPKMLLWAVLGRVVYRRRKFLPRLTLGPDGKPLGNSQGVLIEYYDPNYEEWLPIERTGAKPRLLKDECGIRFGDAGPPMALRMIPLADLQIRVTATIEGDDPIGKTRRHDTQLEDTISQTVWGKSRYAHNERARYNVRGHVAGADVIVDDRNAMRDEAGRLVTSWSAANLAGPLTLFGIDWDTVLLGHNIHNIAGRDISLRTNKGGLADGPTTPARFPTVTSVTYNIQRQETILSLDTFRTSYTGGRR